MKNFKQILVYFLTASMYNCNLGRIHLNKIVFQDNVINVQDSLLEMQGLIKKLPPNIENFNTNYGFENEALIVNGIPGKSTDSSIVYSNEALQKLPTHERDIFLKLAKYLKRNFITAGYIDQQSNLCLFVYRELPNNSFNDVREIAVLRKPDTIVFRKEYKILDHEGMLYLIAPKDAQIR